MTVYYVDDGGDNSTGADWATAYTSMSALDDAVTLASGDIVYIGHDSVDQYAHSANREITGPASGAPVTVISVTQGSDPPVYQASVTDQISTNEATTTYTLTFNGSFAFYGVRIRTGNTAAGPSFVADANEISYSENCTVVLGGNGSAGHTSDLAVGRAIVRNCVFDLTGDGTTARSAAVQGVAWNAEYIGNTYVNAGYRTGSVFSISSSTYASNIRISGCDFSGFTNATACEIVIGNAAATVVVSNCLTAATWAPWTSDAAVQGGSITFINCGPADAPTYLAYKDYYGTVLSYTSVYRTGGATIEGTACSWQLASSANAGESAPLYTPWIYGTISATGSKTFTVYIAQDGGSADLTDAQIWLEVESLSTADEALTALASDHRTITATAAAQTDDATSTWTGITATYKQLLAVTATVAEDGLYRARIALGVASTTVYIDPKVTVS